MDTAVYFGPPGQLRRLWDPTGGILATRELETSLFVSGSGGARVSKALNGTRQYQLNYRALGRDNWEYLNNIHQGGMGPGPFVLLDPGRRNLLTPNQSTATSVTNDTRDFTVSGTGGSLESDSALTPLFRALRYRFSTTTPASASLLLDKPSKVWPGIPVIDRPYTFWCMAISGPVTIALTLRWMGLDGTTLSTSTSAGFAITGSWSTPSFTATPPAGAVWVQPGIAPDVSTIAAGESVYFRHFMLNEGSSRDSRWQIGTGVYPVQTLSLPETYGFAEPGMLVSPVLTLQELR